MNTQKIIAITFISILILNMILFAARVISDTVFWVVILASFAVSYTLKKINKKEGKKK